MILESLGAEETFRIGEMIGQKAWPGMIICLNGDLGVGKTVLSKGIARGLGITEPVSSPTFTIIQEYTTGRLPLYHFDVYRIGEPDEMDELGYEDYFFGQGVCLIEWAARIEELIPKEAVLVTIEKDLEKGLSYRRISMETPQ